MIDKALIIRTSNKLSRVYSDYCAKSCDMFGVDYTFIEGVEAATCKEAYSSVGVNLTNGYSNSAGNCGCHASHIKVWKYIMDIDKACAVFEHDAVIKGDIHQVDVPDMAIVVLGHRVKNVDEYTPTSPVKTILPIQRSIGTHAYAITPKTAKYLYELSLINGVFCGIDRFLMMERRSGLPLFVAEPPQVVCWERKSTISCNMTGVSINYPESLTEGWFAGLV